MSRGFNLFHHRDCPSAGKRKRVKKILKEGRKARQGSAVAEAGADGSGHDDDLSRGAHAGADGGDGAHGGGNLGGSQDVARDGGNVNDNADSICWFCHADVTRLENNKCAGCRKVTHMPRLQIYLNVQARYCDERCQRADWDRHGDYCVKIQEKIRKKIQEKIRKKIQEKLEKIEKEEAKKQARTRSPFSLADQKKPTYPPTYLPTYLPVYLH